MNELYKKMKTGSEKQIAAWEAVRDLGVLLDMSKYNPTLCGTVPIGIDTAGSDLDIIMEVHDFEKFEKRLVQLYSQYDGFKIKRTSIRGMKVTKANFTYMRFPFELFGQAMPVNRQNAYLHMIIEQRILNENPKMKEDVIKLKQRGMKTEPAFCKLLGIQGDPYMGLIRFGVMKGYINRP
ncbi:DUF4269 domain-containing protein [Bacillus sp. SCS-153A]|uniref:DUF4269 domain-containing protein n=1 Tax=Rossellomorea sedimentorum TaxID=3115294 RepID=UPI003906776B